ncbi:hypothetical protein F4778DRAFT_253751 [Xylariomycetidae sp. FL2044]|nr:hypothetical protein F4778DRAFT_253751 [Xylariomycetidae sp. FL2044]
MSCSGTSNSSDRHAPLPMTLLMPSHSVVLLPIPWFLFLFSLTPSLDVALLATLFSLVIMPLPVGEEGVRGKEAGKRRLGM